MAKLLKIFLVIVLVAAIIGGGVGYYFYKKVFNDNVANHQAEYELLIPTGSSYDDVMTLLDNSGAIIDMDDLKWVAGRMNYTNNVKAGRYFIKDHWNSRKVIELLRSGKQEPLNVVLNKFRTIEQVAGFVSSKIEADSANIHDLLTDSSYLAVYGLNKETAISLILPNTYEFFWNTSAVSFMERMDKEYERFWTDARKAKAKRQGVTPAEAIVVASIVEEESNKKDEYARIAGVYLNRVKKGMKLQADPTVKFAVGDFTLRRILRRHTKVESPYNTYYVKGLPPGPICTPSLPAIEAVLNAEDHKYIFFCARPDGSGYHSFAATLREHNNNARAYHKKLNERGIR